jgi:hypothetical protein
MALVSLERAHCSDPSFTKLLVQGTLHGAGVPGECIVLIRPLQNYLLREHYKALVFLERAHCSAPSFTKLLAQGALHGAGVPGESALFFSVLHKTTCSGSAAWRWCPWRELIVLIRPLQNYLLRERCMALVSLVRACCSDPSCTKLLAQGALHGAGVPGESFTKLLAQGALHGPGIPWRDRVVLTGPLQKLLAQGALHVARVPGESALF